MRIGTATVIAAAGLALAGCGGAPQQHASDSVTSAGDSLVAAGDSVVPANAPDAALLGPASNPRMVITGAAPVAQDDNVVPQPPALPSCPEGPSVHFDTPQAAMTYLAAAWNRNDLAALCQVTNPNSRFLLNDMHREAVNLQLKKCEPMDVGRYVCTFTHDYPKRLHRHGTGRTWLQVAAADNPGWYLLDYVGCG